MKVFQEVTNLTRLLTEINANTPSVIGFVPTMGALHNGHLSLITTAKLQCDIVICSIFVNPTQFNDRSDFEKYPIQIDRDLELLLNVGCDIVFIPSESEIYPNGLDADLPTLNLGFLGTTLEAEKRPGHYEGVVQVVKRLLEIVQPKILFLGQKDYQQCMVIQRLIDYYQLPTKVRIVETIRETDGLAMSSRNVRLTVAGRMIAPKLYHTLLSIREHYKNTDFNALIAQQIAILQQSSLIKIEYLVIVNGKDLTPIDNYTTTTPLTTLIAAFVGDVRLIDNLILQ